MENTMSVNQSLSSFFGEQDAKLEARKAARASSGSGKMYPFNLTQKDNLGTLICRIIPDAKGVPLRITTDIWSMTLPNLKDDGSLDNESHHRFEIPDVSNYRVPLTAEDKEIYDRAVKLMERLNELEIPYYECGSLTYFYAKPIRLLKEDNSVDLNEETTIRIFSHRSAGFYPALSNAINLKSKGLGGSKEFLSKYFSRELGPSINATLISTAKGDIGYNVTVSLEALEIDPATGPRIEESDLEIAKDLDLISPAINVFPKEEFIRNITIMSKMVSEKETATRAATGAVPNLQSTLPYPTM